MPARFVLVADVRFSPPQANKRVSSVRGTLDLRQPASVRGAPRDAASVTQSPNHVRLSYQVGSERSAQSLLADDATASAGVRGRSVSLIPNIRSPIVAASGSSSRSVDSQAFVPERGIGPYDRSRQDVICRDLSWLNRQASHPHDRLCCRK